MKLYIKLLIVLFLFTGNSCEKEDDQPQDPIDQLPPASQTGEQTFGCLIDGKAFLPDTFGRGRPNAFYQYIDGKYTFAISSSNDENQIFKGIILTGREVEPLLEEKYSLSNKGSGNYFGEIMIDLNLFTTNNDSSGFLKITNFDEENYILSGTFEFTVLDDDGNEIEITDGRFDVKYTN